MRFEIYQLSGGRWFWKLLAPNGRVRAASPQVGYGKKSHCKQAVKDLVADFRRFGEIIVVEVGQVEVV